MKKELSFLLSPEQHEVLLAFEQEESLSAVSDLVKRDPSVVSRSLKAIADTAPLLEKHNGKWRITPLGRQFNQLTKTFLETQQTLLQQSSMLRLTPAKMPGRESNTALLLIGTQVGFLSSQWGARNNPDAETKMAGMLKAWRARKGFTIFCQHLSKEQSSPLRLGTSGGEFIKELSPRKTELVVTKHHNSAFVGTELAKELGSKNISNVILAGFSTCHCIDATARSASDNGFNVFVLSDATATFDRVGPDGKTYSAATLHAATLAALHQEYATVIESGAMLQHFMTEV